MHDDGYIIQQNPPQMLHAFNVPGVFLQLAAYRFFHPLSQSPDLRGATAIANHEKRGNGFRHFSQVKGYYVFAFFAKNGFNDDAHQFWVVVLMFGLLAAPGGSFDGVK